MIFAVKNATDETVLTMESESLGAVPTSVHKAGDVDMTDYAEWLLDAFGQQATCEAIASRVGGPYGYLVEGNDDD